MTRCPCNMPAPAARDGVDRPVVHELVGHDGHDRTVKIVFTDRQIAYLNDRMAAIGNRRPLGRIGGPRSSATFPEGPPFR